jgi:hypothetical protein
MAETPGVIGACVELQGIADRAFAGAVSTNKKGALLAQPRITETMIYYM